MTVVDGDYDDAVRAAESESKGAHGILIQDTAWPGFEEIPKVSSDRTYVVNQGISRIRTAEF